jgi:acetyl-CoA carboxylase carboxyl transferase subunit alpha
LAVHDTLIQQLEDLRRYKPDKLVRRRRDKFMRMGQYLE